MMSPICAALDAGDCAPVLRYGHMVGPDEQELLESDDSDKVGYA
jgi:hypothetical protein